MTTMWRLALLVLLAVSLVSCQGKSTEERAGKDDAAGSRRLPRDVRKPAVAGSWYPDDREDLAAMVDGFLAKADAEVPADAGPVRALISPHAGYSFSGPTAASGYELLRGQDIHRVIVVGPAHKVPLRGLSIAEKTHYRTPLGEIELDGPAIARLRRDPMVVAHPQAHRKEHSIEMQLPMLQRVLEPGWKLVPVLVGRLDDEGYAQAAELLRGVCDPRTVVIASGDFTHYGRVHDYVPFPLDDEIAERLRDLDMGAYSFIEARDPAGLSAYKRRTEITACGFGPIMIVLDMLPEDAKVKLARYERSGDLTGSYRNSVSYLSVAISAKEPLGRATFSEPIGRLSQPDMELLHLLARRSLQHAVTRGPTPPDVDELIGEQALPPELRRKSGAFVTLKREGQLRGCIGAIQATRPLYRAVIDNAVNAALHDSRFRPVKADELEGMEVEVSVLSPLSPIESHEQYDVAEHGIMLEKAGRSAVYLPKVASEQGWTKEEALTHLAEKARLPSDAWREGTRFWVFTAQVHAAPY
jgi:AmmeMemoRadiSam system protein B/AmmeMemoRadiSam system protein A